MLELAWGSRSDVGHRRTRNEDAFLAAARLFVVADGMGGHDAGDVASRLAIEALAPLADDPALTRLSVLDAVRAGNDAIVAAGRETTAGMGTTVCGLCVIPASATAGDRVLVFNVGDSRAYLLRDGELRQLTRDHSVVQELLDRGVITEHEAAVHPERNVITRSLGSQGDLQIDWWLVQPRPGDRYLISSDGLSKEVDAAQVGQLMASAPTAQAAADALVEAALLSGGRDNVTVVVVAIEAVGDAEDATFDPLEADTNPNLARPDAITVPPAGGPT